MKYILTKRTAGRRRTAIALATSILLIITAASAQAISASSLRVNAEQEYEYPRYLDKRSEIDAEKWTMYLIVVVIATGMSFAVVELHCQRNSKEIASIKGLVHAKDDAASGKSGGSSTMADRNGNAFAATSGGVSGAIPRVKISKEVVAGINDGIRNFRAEHRAGETGFALAGKVVGKGNAREIVINGLVDAGPQSSFSAGHIKCDVEYQQRELYKYQLIDGDVGYMGNAHLHPGDLDRCSAGDLQTDRGNVKDSKSQEMVFVIATFARHSKWNPNSSKSLFMDNLKFDFFYLGYSSGYNYVRISPEIVEEPMIVIPDALNRLAEHDLARSILDFNNLHRLQDFSLHVGEDEDGFANLLFKSRKKSYSIMVQVNKIPWAKPRVFVLQGGETREYAPDFLNGKWTPQIWFTPIILAAQTEIEGLNNTDTTNEEVEVERSSLAEPVDQTTES